MENFAWEFLNKELNGFRVLWNKVNGRFGYYIENCSLIGIPYFGIVDYGTNVIEVKPNTGCALDCVYCSSWESRKEIDFVVNKDDLVKWFNEVKRYKEKKVEAYLSSQGDVLMYPWIVDLVNQLTKKARVVIDTHGYFLNKEIIQKLSDAGLERMNIVLNTLKQEMVERIYGKRFDIQRLLENIRIANKEFDITLSPVVVKGYNDSELKELIRWAKENINNSRYPGILPQNYMYYHGGKKLEIIPFKEFISFLKKLEIETKEKLLIDFEKDFGIVKDGNYPKKFSLNDVIEGKALIYGRSRNELIIESSGRLILVGGINGYKPGDILEIRIKRNHLFYEGEILRKKEKI